MGCRQSNDTRESVFIRPATGKAGGLAEVTTGGLAVVTTGGLAESEENPYELVKGVSIIVVWEGKS